jgi:hypothetical protein
VTGPAEGTQKRDSIPWSAIIGWVIVGGGILTALGYIGYAASGIGGAINTIAIYAVAPAALAGLVDEIRDLIERRKRKA